ncbi:menaquinone biosynthetic enzyme MqnA/MqnD family protein [Geobacter sp. DSM 9736]|uniref:menaquinone biosynthetic enzyme MqnA/MqnD family protein n=1 Tax=Geobacter sp. DSM 9736 TaxID=1277350 RepID=UPI000B50003E|nr:menaquinone biosynthesis protein [Geobacter sp. DSM 9736]SNB46177.1 chorismate dehydratase [Geobacter sp. DSM 9736]
MTLNIGHIKYANCTPIFSALLDSPACSKYSFVGGVPSVLNALLRSGEIDVCPSSSIEYGKSPGKYLLLPELSISSVGPVKSVLLFSRLPMEQLDGARIGLTTDSDTSVNLLKIILRKQFGFLNDMERTGLPLAEALRDFSALLLIGDAALRESMKFHGLHVYDLGELWWRFTGLPFVFALWLVTEKTALGKPNEVAALWRELVQAKERAYGTYARIASRCAERSWMSEEDLADYWRIISYELTPEHLKGVDTFFGYASELGIIAERPQIRLFSPNLSE